MSKTAVPVAFDRAAEPTFHVPSGVPSSEHVYVQSEVVVRLLGSPPIS